MKDPFFSPNIKSGTRQDNLDWDETAMDSQKSLEGVHDDDRTKREFLSTRLVLLAAFVLLVGRLFYLQIVQGEYFRDMAENNRIRSQVLQAPRGLVMDRNNKPLLENIAGFNLVAVPFDLDKSDINRQVENLAFVLNLDKDSILQKLQNVDRRSITPVVVSQDLSADRALLFQTRAFEFPGFSVDKTPIRHYFQPLKFSSLLGYTGLASDLDINNFQLSEEEKVSQVGKQGLELQYEKFLRGLTGQNQVEVDSTGKILKVLGQSEGKPGNSLVLNIDSDLQELLYDLLTKNNPAHTRAAAVALNPKNGEVLALLSLPGYNNNLFAHGISQAEYKKLLEDPNKPFLNRAISGQYPPGSTVKPMVAAAALTEGIVKPDTIIVDRGVLVIPNQFDPAVSYDFVGWKRSGLGAMDVRSAIAQSSDIYFYTVSGGHPNSRIQGLGAQKLADYYRRFSLGRLTGVDLPAEKPGIVADPAWKEKAFANDAIMKKWYLGDTYHIGIGQGDMLATPLQVAVWTSIIANNGTGLKPRILNKVINAEGEEIFKSSEEILVKKFLPDDVLKAVQEGMRETVLSGSGRQLNNLPITSAGKTGTSQFDGSDPKKTHAWFTSYAPFEDPSIVIVVLVEAGGEGHAAAVPVAKEALEWWAENRYGK